MCQSAQLAQSISVHYKHTSVFLFSGWCIMMWCTAALYHESTLSQIISLILFSFAGSAGKRSVNALGCGVFLGELNAASLWGVMNNDDILVTSPWEGRKYTERPFVLCSQSHLRNEEAGSELRVVLTSLPVTFCSSLHLSTKHPHCPRQFLGATLHHLGKTESLTCHCSEMTWSWWVSVQTLAEWY